MSWLLGARTRLRLLLRRRSEEERMAEEFRFHLEMATEDLVRAGVEAGEARRRAMLAFGGMSTHRESMREGRGMMWVEDLLRDLRYAWRSLRRGPGFTAAAVLTIAIGIGATTIVFSLVNSLLLRPLPFPEADRLFGVTEDRSGAVYQGMEGRAMPYDRYLEYRASMVSVFDDIAAHRFADFSLRTDEGAVPINGTLVSGNYFSVLGLRPAEGRFFVSDDEAAVVLAHHVWRGRYGGEPDVIGTTVYLDGQPFTVVGVAPPGFIGTTPGLPFEVWVPLLAKRERSELPLMTSWISIFGRLASDSSPGEAAALADLVARRIPPGQPQTRVRGARLDTMTGIMRGTMRREGTPAVALLFGLAASVLLIGSANITGMLLSRGLARRREMAIRLAIGAARRRLVRQLLTESCLLALIGGAGGVLLAVLGTRLIAAAPLPLPPSLALDVSLDVRVLSFALGLALVTSILFGLVPALRTSRPVLIPALKDGGSTGGTTHTPWRNLFVSGQIAIAVTLSILAILFVTSLQRASAVDLGYDAEGVMIATTNIGAHGYDEQRGRAFLAELTERLTELPGVQSVSLAQAPLVGGSIISNDMEAVDIGRREQGVAQNRVGSDFFEIVRLPIVMGRGFTDADQAGSPSVTVINETLAERFWPAENPIGRIISSSGGQFEVIGVARDGRYSFGNGLPAGYAFFPFAQRYSGRMTLHVRGSAPPVELIRSIREQVRLIDPDVAVDDAQLLSTALSRQFGLQRMGATVLAMLGAAGLLLAGIGVYGVLAFQVAQRRREFGVRIALGATGRAVVRHVLGSTTKWAITGTLIGLSAGGVATFILQRFLFGISASDPALLGTIALVLLMTALAACYIPVRRATRSDPIQVLRAE